ncbi:MAG: sensor histidine kinase [Actinomycetes bacterium]
MAANSPGRTDASLQRLRLIGLVGPVAFVALLLCLRPLAIDWLGHRLGLTLIGTVLVVSAAGFGWTMYRRLDTAHEAVVAAERRSAALVERERIARELHDSLAQVLGVTHLRLHALAGRRGLATDDTTRGEVLELADLCHEAYRDVREAILGLRDATRTDRTLLEHLDGYVAAFARTSSIPTTLVADADDEFFLSPAAEVQVIRVIQEALTNVRKHSGARSATVLVSAQDDHAQFVVADDGTGFDPHALASDGFGLSAMRERAESVDGRLMIDSAPGQGTRVVVRLPGRRRSQAPVEPGFPVPASPAPQPAEELSA